MEVKLLKHGYNDKKEIYADFIAGTINYDNDYYSNEYKIVNEIPNFPIYLAHSNETEFVEAVKVLNKHMVHSDRDIHLNGRFWHSFLLVEKREYILNKYPQIKKSIRDFNNIVLKKFDWENYIYKCVLLAEYIEHESLNTWEEKEKFIKNIYYNLDLFNYIIKYPLFRNSDFIIKFFTIIKEEGLSHKMKERIKHRNDLGKDERYGRRVFLELNKNYPIIMSPFLEKTELKSEIYKALDLYEQSNDLLE